MCNDDPANADVFRCGTNTDTAANEIVRTVKVELKPGTYRLFCDGQQPVVHENAGMYIDIYVGGVGPVGSSRARGDQPFLEAGTPDRRCPRTRHAAPGQPTPERVGARCLNRSSVFARSAVARAARFGCARTLPRSPAGGGLSSLRSVSSGFSTQLSSTSRPCRPGFRQRRDRSGRRRDARPVARPELWAADVIAAQPVVWNALFASLQLAIALGLFGLLGRRMVRPALAASIVWSLGIWWFGEGLGGLLTGGARSRARRPRLCSTRCLPCSSGRAESTPAPSPARHRPPLGRRRVGSPLRE